VSVLLETRSVEKPWGRDTLPPPFTAPAGKRIGEIWFVPPAEFDQLLVKYIFTSEKLSVQVHPSDAQAAAGRPGDHGKEECWLVIDAEPGARLGLGLTRRLNRGELRAAALDGSIEHLLDWRPVSAGDFFRILPGTVHAIGPGVTLVEIQQNSDTTYRLYDYGRPRELHLDLAVAVARGEPYDAAHHRKLGAHGGGTLVDGPHFRVDLIDRTPGEELADVYAEGLLVIPLIDEVRIARETVRAGRCALARRPADVALGEGARCLLARPLS
jgi:mannose-6-phosphate isomerase